MEAPASERSDREIQNSEPSAPSQRRTTSEGGRSAKPSKESSGGRSKRGQRVSFTPFAEYQSDATSDTHRTIEDEEEDVDRGDLLNSVGLAVTTRRSLRSHASLETCLLTAGIQVEHSAYCGSGAFLPRAPMWGIGEDKGGSKAGDDDSEQSNDSSGNTWDSDLLQRFFSDGHGPVQMKQAHVALDSIVRHVIDVNTLPEETAGKGQRGSCGTWSTISFVTMVTALFQDGQARSPPRFVRSCNRLRRAIIRMVASSAFQNFFLVLTLYVMFGPDLATYVGDIETDRIFLYINTSVFGLFILEFMMLSIGRTWYLLSMAALLDLVSILSMVGDTWFLAYDAGLFQEEGARLSRVARSARVTRLVRVAKVARAGRLLPRLLQLVRRQQSALARMVLLKKVWRVFLFLDTDGDSLVSMFDLKVFYFNILQECEHMVFTRRQALLRADIDIFAAEQAELVKRDFSDQLTFEEFSRIFLSTKAGKDLLRFFILDIEQASTVWALTNKLSDTAALKTCLLVLVLVVAMSVFELDTQDRSPEQGLGQLDMIARAEHSSNLTTGAYLCSQIAVYRVRQEVLMLFLDGRTHFESGICLPRGVPAAELNPFARAETLVATMSLRASEVLQACMPATAPCGLGVSSSMVLLDQRAQASQDSLFALLTMVTIVALLVFFVLVMKVKIQKFTSTLVNPLRSLSDDMVAMSSLDILTIPKEERETPFPEPKIEIDELKQLKEALESMQTTIRSWSLYVPPCVVQRLFSKGIEAEIGVARCNVSILFCDIDGFEDACGDLLPQEVINLLSLVLGKIADVIEERHGTLLEFIGDEVLAVFNTPQFVKHHVYAAAAAAIEIHRVVDGLPKMFGGAGKEIPVRCRVGVNTGSTFAGNIGSKNRMKYGLLGDGVNLAARLKTLNSLYRTRTLVSAAVVEDRAVAKMFVHRPIDVVAVKGKKQPTVVFEVMGDEPSSQILLQKAAAKHTEGFTLYRKREFGKAVAAFAHAGNLFAAGRHTERVTAIMRRRCNTLIEQPPAEDWDGVERLTRKSWEEVADETPEALHDVAIGPDGQWRQDSTLGTLAVLDALEPPESPKQSGPQLPMKPCAERLTVSF